MVILTEVNDRRMIWNPSLVIVLGVRKVHFQTDHPLSKRHLYCLYHSQENALPSKTLGLGKAVWGLVAGIYDAAIGKENAHRVLNHFPTISLL